MSSKLKRWSSWCVVTCASIVGALGLEPVSSAAIEPETAPAQSAEEVVQRTSDKMLKLIDESRSYAHEDPERFYAEVEALLAPVVDFKGFARSVMAVYYRDASPDQRNRFAETFKSGLVHTYALALTDFHNGKVVIVPPQGPPRSERRRSVKMEIHLSTGEVYPVVYSMALEKDGMWRVRNIIINGINIGLTYRSQFASAVRDPKYGGDLDKVIDAWASLLASNDATTKDAPSTTAGSN